jgi:hypothetical protein
MKQTGETGGNRLKPKQVRATMWQNEHCRISTREVDHVYRQIYTVMNDTLSPSACSSPSKVSGTHLINIP